MRAEHRYAAALAAAFEVVQFLDMRPHRSREETLAATVFTILDAIYAAEQSIEAESESGPPALRKPVDGD